MTALSFKPPVPILGLPDTGGPASCCGSDSGAKPLTAGTCSEECDCGCNCSGGSNGGDSCGCGCSGGDGGNGTGGGPGGGSCGGGPLYPGAGAGALSLQSDLSALGSSGCPPCGSTQFGSDGLERLSAAAAWAASRAGRLSGWQQHQC
jgi:hypothetical protein